MLPDQHDGIKGVPAVPGRSATMLCRGVEIGSGSHRRISVFTEGRCALCGNLLASYICFSSYRYILSIQCTHYIQLCWDS